MLPQINNKNWICLRCASMKRHRSSRRARSGRSDRAALIPPCRRSPAWIANRSVTPIALPAKNCHSTASRRRSRMNWANVWLRLINGVWISSKSDDWAMAGRWLVSHTPHSLVAICSKPWWYHPRLSSRLWWLSKITM